MHSERYLVLIYFTRNTTSYGINLLGKCLCMFRFLHYCAVNWNPFATSVNASVDVAQLDWHLLQSFCYVDDIGIVDRYEFPMTTHLVLNLKFDKIVCGSTLWKQCFAQFISGRYIFQRAFLRSVCYSFVYQIWRFESFITSRVCSRGNVFIVSVCLCVCLSICLCVCMCVCVCVSVCLFRL